MRVWRVENREGKGPYAARAAYGEDWDRVDSHHPLHGMVHWAAGRFVFTSKAELLAWFPRPLLRSLVVMGFRVRSWEAPTVILGNKQGFVPDE